MQMTIDGYKAALKRAEDIHGPIIRKATRKNGGTLDKYGYGKIFSQANKLLNQKEKARIDAIDKINRKYNIPRLKLLQEQLQLESVTKAFTTYLLNLRGSEA